MNLPATGSQDEEYLPSLGSCTSFAALAGTKLLFNSSKTILKFGSVGCTTSNRISGSYLTSSGTTQSATSAAFTCMNDKNIAYSRRGECKIKLNPELGGLTLTPGQFCSYTGLFTLNVNSLTLDGRSCSGSLWQFQTTSSLVTGAYSSVILKNGALASNIYWFVGTSTSLGASSFFVGNIISPSSIFLGSRCILQGRGLSSTSVTFDGGSLVSLTASYSDSSITMGGNCQNYAILARSSISFGTGRSIFSTGSIGVPQGATVTGNFTLRKGITDIGSSTSLSGYNEYESMYNSGSTLTCRNRLTNDELSGLSLSPGVYCSGSGKFSIGQMGAVVLDANNVVGATWVFQMGGDFITGSFSSVQLKNGALSSNVHWIVASNASHRIASVTEALWSAIFMLKIQFYLDLIWS